ncbi:MAG: CSN-associated deubiquitinating enzyme Ubp12 [Lichina confinis]|nr:MAG: CSN-associated deubiquitinating enzyme Ubp12 [Lichina confinis]
MGKRFVHNTNAGGDAGSENLQYEIYPPVFTVVKLQPGSSSSNSAQPPNAGPVRTLASRSEAFNNFLRRAKGAVSLPVASKVRVWRIIRTEKTAEPNGGLLTPATSRNASPVSVIDAVFDKVTTKLGLDLELFLSLEEGSQRELLDVPDQTANENYNGRMSLALAGLSQDEVIVLEERVNGADGGGWLSQAPRVAADKAGVIPISITKGRSTPVQNEVKGRGASTTSRQPSPAPAVGGGIMTRGRARKNGRSLGTCGLSNLGNTCYMNSALQCVRSVEELTQYFRLQNYKADLELNSSNSLAYYGDVAKAYANLLDQVYSANCPASIAPRSFKHTIGRYGPSFSGYGQQDSQEFLGFLLDGVSEGLNRIQKKPYIEVPDSTDEMVDDPEALRQFADRCWEIYKARNDSVVVDLFAGTYKSTLVCPVCKKVSIKFDPFNNLTLQLPIESVWAHKVFFFPLHDRPFQVLVNIDRNGSIRSMKEFISSRVDVPPERLHAVEIYKHKVFKAYEDVNCVSDVIQQNDEVAVFELDQAPTNWPPPPEKPRRTRPILTYSNSDDDEDAQRWDPAVSERVLVPIFHRYARDPRSRNPSWAQVGVPVYIVLNKEEAMDFDVILRKILLKVDTLTTVDLFQDESSDSSNGPEDDVVVLTTSDDTDSSAEVRTKTQSVEGEDDMVSVSIKDPADAKQTEQPNGVGHAQGPEKNKKKKKKKKKTLRPGSFIKPELRNLFRVRVFHQAGEIVPTSWSTNLEEDRAFTFAENRMARTPSESPVDEGPGGSLMPGQRASSESETEQSRAMYVKNPFAGTDAGSESEPESLPPLQRIFPSHAVAKRNPPRNGQRGAKGNRRRAAKPKFGYSRKQKRPSSGPSETTPDGVLVRPGEAIVLDWKYAAYEELFLSHGASDSRLGTPTWEQCELMPDEELQRKIALRASRRRQGITLADCLDEFGKEEILSENNAWRCPKCKEFRQASKKFELWKAPDILVMHLKRFSASRGLRDKVDVMVDFPTEGLDLTDRVALKEEGKSLIYDLVAVDNHYGGLGGGHYTAITRNFVDGQWYDYNGEFSRILGPRATYIG